MKKTLITLSISLFLLIIMISVLWNIYYIDETIIDGEKYGFIINERKVMVYKRIINNEDFNIKAIQIGTRSADFRVISIDELDFNLLKKYSTWLLLLDSKDSFLNTIRLDFADDKLKRIYRHRKFTELP